MRTRLIACLAGGLLGAVVSLRVGDSLNMSPLVVLIGCSLLGMGLGYAVSMFFDVFAAGADESTGS